MIKNKPQAYPLSINIKGQLLSFEKPLVMGILNITKDSFYQKSRYPSIDQAETATRGMLEAGAKIIDIGAASSRPGATLISSSQEIEELLPVLTHLIKQFPNAIFSVDTYNSKTAEAAIKSGAAIINDISAGLIDAVMFETIGKLNVPYVMMHMQGLPETMQEAPHYENVLNDIIDFFTERVATARAKGIKDLIIDPGFGFGKLLEHNYELLRQLHLFEVFKAPVLCGLSRKSLINKVIHSTAEHALNGTSVLNTIALLNGAKILRVHDVKEAIETIELVTYYQNVNLK